MLICFILLPLWAVFVALARGDLIIISPMGQVVNIIFQVFWFFFESFCFSIKNPSVYAGLRHYKRSFDNKLITVIASAIILVIQWFMGNGMIIGWLAD